MFHFYLGLGYIIKGKFDHMKKFSREERNILEDLVALIKTN
jgi:hypothetical protein